MKDLDDLIEEYNEDHLNRLQKWFGVYYQNLIIIVVCIIWLILAV